MRCCASGCILRLIRRVAPLDGDVKAYLVGYRSVLGKITPLHAVFEPEPPLLSFAVWGPHHAWRFTRGDEVVEVPVRGQFSTNNGQALLSAAMAGMGVIVQADALLAPAIAAGEVVPCLIGGFPRVRYIWSDYLKQDLVPSCAAFLTLW
ncbi:LysR substrate-binding domain-containing protein [Burkholderia ubonensis]|uniref:LysR substrate-binding domain-containing protein n=1 Tax=Burkholderia ubonensis TaxID=101571 RepID=UPI0038CD371C